MNSCIFMPPSAPHYHKYNSIITNSYVNEISVFDTPRNKRYHFFAKEGLKIKGCSSVFIDSCYTFDYDEFFNEMKYQKSIRMRDRQFHKLLKNDTLELFINDKKFLFIPVLN
ncbi:MAG: hypothetical protein L3J14_06980 [Flavobacteriaceae bacterium]|nr:hypothetical protein [Flavobacteriaceae bacterium]